MKKIRHRVQRRHKPVEVGAVTTEMETTKGVALGVGIGMMLCAAIAALAYVVHATGNDWLFKWMFAASIAGIFLLQGNILGVPIFSSRGRRTFSWVEFFQQASLIGFYALLVFS